jgi:hypothetical protein
MEMPTSVQVFGGTTHRGVLTGSKSTQIPSRQAPSASSTERA